MIRRERAREVSPARRMMFLDRSPAGKRCWCSSASGCGNRAKVRHHRLRKSSERNLSHVIEAGMITYKGLPAPLVCDHLSREASRRSYDPGTEFQIDRIERVGNTGTYLDTPFHRYADGEDLSALSLDKVSGRNGVVVRVTGARDRAIDWSMFAAVDVRGKAVLVHTGWDRHWRTDRYFEQHPHLTEAAAIYLRDHGATLVGIDSFNVDDTAGGARPVHTVLLGAGVPIVEHMTGLDAASRRLPLLGGAAQVQQGRHVSSQGARHCQRACRSGGLSVVVRPYEPRDREPAVALIGPYFAVSWRR